MDTTCLEESAAMKAEDISTIEDARLWAVERDAWREQQWKFNDQMEDKMKSLSHRTRILENKVIWFTACAATLGGLLGSGTGRLFQALSGG